MANRRMLSKTISISEQANDLSDFAALLFTWMIPHADDWGVLPGSSRKIKALVIPLRPQTAEDVEAALTEMVDAELIWRYEVEGQQFIQFRTWEKHQEGLHKRSKPKQPLYQDSIKKDVSETFPEIPGNSGSIEENRTEENRTESPIRAREEFASANADIVAAFYKFRPVVKQEEAQLINDMIEHYPRDWLIEAIKIASERKKTHFGYIDGIVRDWRVKGFKDADKPWESERHGKSISKAAQKARSPGRDFSEYDR